jgi:hypothetical protein
MGGTAYGATAPPHSGLVNATSTLPWLLEVLGTGNYRGDERSSLSERANKKHRLLQSAQSCQGCLSPAPAQCAWRASLWAMPWFSQHGGAWVRCEIHFFAKTITLSARSAFANQTMPTEH